MTGGGAQRVAHIRLFEDFLLAGPGAAISEKMFGVEVGTPGAVNDVHEAEVDGIGHGDAEVQIPWRQVSSVECRGA